MKYAFVRAHREEFGVRAMCRMLRVHVSGFYAWLKEPVSARAKEDVRQTALIREAWSDSGKVYGYRKLHDDLRDRGETCSPNRVARLASLAGIAAQIGYRRRRPGQYGGKPAIVAENKLDRQFETDAPDQAWVTDITYVRTHEGWSYLSVVHCVGPSTSSPVASLARRPRLVHATMHDDRACPAGTTHGCLAQEAERHRPGSLGPRQPILESRMEKLPVSPWSRAQHEQTRQLP